MKPIACIITCLALSAVLSAAAQPAEADRLFEDDSLLAVTIKGPLTTLTRKRPKDEELRGTLTLNGADGSPVTVDVELRTRGNFRLDRKTCPFPPVRLNFKKRQVRNTAFHKQDKLKLVTHCRDGSPQNRAAVQREYLAYRVLNVLTDSSFRVRLLEITWVDSEKNDRSMTRFGFVIEDTGQLAKRIGRKQLKVPGTSIAKLDPSYTSLSSVYQYLIANTDFSPIAAAAGQDCCHNGVLLSKSGALIYSVPYDFDMAGFVDAPYASPNPRFKIRNVKQRLYRGRCANNAVLPETLALFRERRGAIEALVREHAYLDDQDRNETLRFIAAFYDIINDPKDVERQLIKRCVG